MKAPRPDRKGSVYIEATVHHIPAASRSAGISNATQPATAGTMELGFDEPFLRGFLDRYARDPDPDKRLDFLSYHQYKHAADPAAVGAEKQTVRRWLDERGLDPDTPVFVTEYGVFPGDTGGPSLTEDLLTQAAAMQTLAYYYANSGMDAAMHELVRDRLGECALRDLRGIVGGEVRSTDDARGRRDVDD